MVFWVFLFVALIIVEFLTPIELITIWYMPAVVVCFILSAFKVSTNIQYMVFIVMAIIGTIILVYYMKKKCIKNSVNLEKYKGEYEVIYLDDNIARIKINDILYKISSENGVKLNAGEKVKVIDISGNKLIVRKED